VYNNKYINKLNEYSYFVNSIILYYFYEYLQEWMYAKSSLI